MIDLETIRATNAFSLSEGPPRIALVHHGFRSTQLAAHDKRSSRFSARYPSLGLLNIARSAQVDFEEGHLAFEPEFRYFDEDCYEDDEALLSKMLAWLDTAPARFLMVGLYSLAFDRTASMLRKVNGDRYCIVVGGAHPTVAPNVDFAHLVVRGEGAAAVRHILSTFMTDGFGEGSDAAGICYLQNGIEHIGRTVFDRSLEKLPAPAFRYDLSRGETGTAKERWWKSLGHNQQIYICTQSCRARCTFCSTYLIHGKLVSRPVDKIAGDMDYIINDLGHDALQFHDDDILQHEDFDELLHLLQSKSIQWSCNARSEFITPELASRLYAAGCRRVFLGAESFDQRSLDYYRKETTVDMNRQAVRALDAAGIGVVCGYIIGAPHDTVDSLLRDFDEVLSLPIYFLAAAILTPDIGTVEFGRAAQRFPELKALGDEPRLNVRPRPDLYGSKAPYGLPTVAEAISKDDLNDLYGMINCAFFLRWDAWARIERYTPPHLVNEALAWRTFHESRALELVQQARLSVVRDRMQALLEVL
ncbi:radical SAM protein [Agrobacterium vitis]|nr:radical SAM protein [Allorhizobium ampelinum]